MNGSIDRQGQARIEIYIVSVASVLWCGTNLFCFVLLAGQFVSLSNELHF